MHSATWLIASVILLQQPGGNPLEVRELDRTARPSARAPGATAASPATASGMGRWLVHLAQHQGHLAGRGNPQAVTMHVLALMQAAAKVEPGLAEPYLWQFDLYGRIDRPTEAAAALQRYVDLSPKDEAAHLLLVATALDRLQTAESRLGYIRERLARPNLPKSVASDLYRREAEIHRERGEIEPAGQAIENALRLTPANVAARQLSYEMFGETEAALQRVELALTLIAANPGQVNLLWELGEMLDSLSLHREAQEWYQRAIEIHGRVSTAPVTADHWAQLAQSYANSGDLPQAAEAVDKALAADAKLDRARLLKASISARRNETEADASMDQLAASFVAQAEQVVAERNVAKAAELAWFFAYHKPDATRATQLAQIALRDPNAPILARRAQGYAHLLGNQFNEALEVLRPLAARDQLSALGAAKALLGLQREGEAKELLHKGVMLGFSGPGYDETVKLLEKLGEKAPMKPGHDKIVKALQRFDRRLFDYFTKVDSFLKLTLSAVEDPLPAVGPWRVRVRIENIGQAPVTVGEGMMAQPLVLFSVQLGDGKGGRYENYHQALLNRRPILMPGDAIEEEVTLDVGALREQLIRSASWTTPVQIEARFDPVATESGYANGPTTVSAAPLRLQRVGVSRERSEVKRVIAQLTAATPAERWRAIDSLGALLAEMSQESAGGQDSAEARSLRRRLVAQLVDADWTIRARTLEALRWSPQSEEVFTAASPLLNDSNFVVQMAAVRFFATQQGEQFGRVGEKLAREATDPTVRLLAGSFMQQAGSAALTP